MDYTTKAREIAGKMTQQEKALLCSGKNFWQLHGFPHLDVPEIMVTDGPHGLRKQMASPDNLGLGGSVPATCFPAACTTACSFDPALLEEMGVALGQECIKENVAVLLGPAINHKRSPLCGRNFEYVSEDPYLTGKLASRLVSGIQSQGVGTSVKHFAANSQEKSRVVSDSVLDERALREIYLRQFEIVVKESQPWTIMAAYNKLNGTYCAENDWLLHQVARQEWGYQNLFVTDWGALSRVENAYLSGLDLEMPGPGNGTDKIILEMLQDGRMTPEQLDVIAIRLLDLILKSQHPQPNRFDPQQSLRLAQKVAEESAVLLKNDGILPLSGKNQSIAVIGTFAKQPRYQGAGSSRINPIELDNACEALIAKGLAFEYADGYLSEQVSGNDDAIAQAVKVATGKDVVLVFAGLPDSSESEGFDRTTLSLPESHNRLIEKVAAANPNVVVILQCGSAVTMPWLDGVKAVLLMYLSGCQSGKATANLLLGTANPSGKLAETFPKRLEDTPCHAYFGQNKIIDYRESIFTGYRYYDSAKKEVLFPFGFGLSYSRFEYSDLIVSATKLKATDKLVVSLTVKNVGSVPGKETVQLYVAPLNPTVFKAEKELKSFAKILLLPGESRKIEMVLDQNAFSYYNVAIHDWHVETGKYAIRVGASSRDIRLHTIIEVKGTGSVPIPVTKATANVYYALPTGEMIVPEEQFVALLGHPLPLPGKAKPFTPDTPIGDLRATLLGKIFVSAVRKGASKQVKNIPDMKKMIESMVLDMPLRSMSMTGSMTKQKVLGIVDIFNGHLIRGLKKMK